MCKSAIRPTVAGYYFLGRKVLMSPCISIVSLFFLGRKVLMTPCISIVSMGKIAPSSLNTHTHTHTHTHTKV